MATGTSLLTSWTFNPAQLALVAVLATAYAVRARTLARQGRPVPPVRQALFATGLGLLFVAFASPLDAVGERELFTAHMAQHVVLGDLAPLCLLAGLTGPMLQPLLAVLPVRRLRLLANPLVALPVWALSFLVWFLPPLFDAANGNDLVHALFHTTLLAGGLILWLPVLETLPAPEWFGSGAKLGYIVCSKMLAMVVGNVFLWSSAPVYDAYDDGVGAYGIPPLGDQQLAAGVMMTYDAIVLLVAVAWLFLRMAQESEARQQLLERGLDPRVVHRAVRYRRWQELT